MKKNYRDIIGSIQVDLDISKNQADKIIGVVGDSSPIRKVLQDQIGNFVDHPQGTYVGVGVSKPAADEQRRIFVLKTGIMNLTEPAKKVVKVKKTTGEVKHYSVELPSSNFFLALESNRAELIKGAKVMDVIRDAVLFVSAFYDFDATAEDQLKKQDDLRKFLMEFGQHAGKSIVVVDLYSPEQFDKKQRDLQRRLLKNMDVTKADLPAIVVSEFNPFQSSKRRMNEAAVLFEFGKFSREQLVPNLRKLINDIEVQKIPSSRRHVMRGYWALFRKYGILGKAFELITGKQPTPENVADAARNALLPIDPTSL